MFDKEDIRSAGTQYANGYLQGRTQNDPKLAQSASGHRQEFFLQGLEDARYGTRKNLTERKAHHVNSEAHDEIATRFFDRLRDYVEAQDERLSEQQVYNGLTSLTMQAMSEHDAAPITRLSDENAALRARVAELETSGAERLARIEAELGIKDDRAVPVK